jgi:hypothetical protein
LRARGNGDFWRKDKILTTEDAEEHRGNDEELRLVFLCALCVLRGKSVDKILTTEDAEDAETMMKNCAWYSSVPSVSSVVNRF